MSWDVLIVDAPPGIRSASDCPADFVSRPLGAAADVLDRLRALPGIDLTDPAWGLLRGAGWSIELNIGADDPITSIMLHVRGGGDDVLPVIARIAAVVGGRALDTSDGDFLTDDHTGAESWHRFQQYRDQLFPQESGGPATG